MNEEETKFYSIGRGNLNIDGKFYYGLDYTITDFMRSLEQERNNYKELYEKENKNWNELKEWIKEIQQEEFDINGFTGVCTEIRIECILDKMEDLERL